MKKNVVITVMVDDVPLAELEELMEQIELTVENYEYKRIDTNLSDTNLVKPMTL
jgi:hypothetical protein